MKYALVTGVTGQDGSYMAELLLSKGYTVYGVVRRSSVFNTERIDHLIHDRHEKGVKFFRLHADLSDAGSLYKIIREVQPDEVYHLGAQSHVRLSFDMPEYTADVTGVGTLRLLEAVRNFEATNPSKKIKFYQASSSEMFGSSPPPQNERTRFEPQSPYGVAKVFAYQSTVNYRRGFQMFAVNGILFNHESPRRGGTFVTRKITRGVAAIAAGKIEKLFLGNLEAKRDWGYAPEFVEAMWRMLQEPEPDDYVVATGESHTVREFAERAFGHAGMDLIWDGEGLNEKGINRKTGRIVVEIDPSYFRPTEVDDLRGDASKARERLGWKPTVTFDELVRIMVESDREGTGTR